MKEWSVRAELLVQAETPEDAVEQGLDALLMPYNAQAHGVVGIVCGNAWDPKDPDDRAWLYGDLEDEALS